MRKYVFILTLLFFFCCFGSPAMAQYDYWAEVYKQENTTVGEMELTPITSGITFKVLTINTDTAATCTVFGSGTSLTNPVTTANFASATACDGKVKFRTSASTVDLIVVDTNGGFTAFVEDFSPNDHKIVIDQRPNVMHHGTIWFGASDNAETDTGVDFLSDTFIHDAWVEVVTVDATETIDVGLLSSETSGDANGLRAAVIVATAGFIADTATVTLGTSADYWSASTYGALLVTSDAGADTSAATIGRRVGLGGHIVTGANAKSITYTGSAGSDTAAGYIHYFFTRMR